MRDILECIEEIRSSQPTLPHIRLWLITALTEVDGINARMRGSAMDVSARIDDLFKRVWDRADKLEAYIARIEKEALLPQEKSIKDLEQRLTGVEEHIVEVVNNRPAPNPDTIPGLTYIGSPTWAGQLLESFRELRWAAMMIDRRSIGDGVSKRVWKRVVDLESYLRARGYREDIDDIINGLSANALLQSPPPMPPPDVHEEIHSRIDALIRIVEGQRGNVKRISDIEDRIDREFSGIDLKGLQLDIRQVVRDLEKFKEDVIRNSHSHQPHEPGRVLPPVLPTSGEPSRTKMGDPVPDRENDYVKSVPGRGEGLEEELKPGRPHCMRCGSVNHSYCGPAGEGRGE